MAYLLGEEIQLGVGPESARGTAVTPSMWIPTKKPASFIKEIVTSTIRETRGTGIMTEGMEIVQTRAVGETELNIRHGSFGYLLKSLMGSVSSSTALGATTHTFTRLASSPQMPSLTFGVAQNGQQDYEYPMGTVDGLNIKVTLSELVSATAKLIAKTENTHADYTPVFDDTLDIYFRPQDVTVKFAASTAGLGAATPICIQELNLNMNNNVKPHQCIGGSAINDLMSMGLEITGSLSADYDGPTTYYDTYTAGTAQAMEIKMERTDLAAIGTSALKPMIKFTFPKVTFGNYKPNRTINDIVKEGVDFTAHFDTTAAAAVTAVIQNAKTNYTS